MVVRITGLLFGLIFMAGCSEDPWNDPYPSESDDANVYYTSFSERPKHLDPARSYSSNEWVITNQIYETPFQYHYLKRPYALEPALANKMPAVRYLSEEGATVAEDASNIAYTEYTIDIKEADYQPHPAFVRTDEGGLLYHSLEEEDVDGFTGIEDFSQTAFRPVVADDFLYQIKRLADPRIHSPIFGLMSRYIVGLEELREELMAAPNIQTINLREFSLSGVQVHSDTRYTILLKGQYPQFQYWLAMPFFAPMPWEAVEFYRQNVLQDKNINLDWYPVGSGPYMIKSNNPNRLIRLVKNPNFHGEIYPREGEEGDDAAGLLALAGQSLPFIDQLDFVLEKETIPYWHKFLQGYYDASGIASDSFDQALQVSGAGTGLALTPDMVEQGIQLNTSIQPSTIYWGFNMLDSVVGGENLRGQKLRQAISIAIDTEEYIHVFLNGRGIAAHNPVPPGIVGHQVGEDYYNPKIYTRDDDGKIVRRSIEVAKTLLAEAGYPEGRDPETDNALILYYDTTSGGGPDARARFAWMRKQFNKLGIELVVRDTQYNRFQDKIMAGTAQIFAWGWNADYPDPENFFFLLYGPNGKVHHQGENAANYDSPRFNALFEQMKNLADGPERLALITQMNSVLQEDSPWIWGYHPKAYTLYHQWSSPTKPHPISRNTIKYIKLDPPKRTEMRLAWNQPRWGLFSLGLLLFGVGVLPAIRQYLRKEYCPPNRKDPP